MPPAAAQVDAAKLADLVLLLVDGDFGFEMETFEFLNILQVHGFPKVMGVLTNLDKFKDPAKLRKTKKTLKQRFWTEIHAGAKLFYLSGMTHGRYNKRDTLNLARFISIAKFRPLTWRQQHPYVVGDRFEDMTDPEAVRQDPACSRTVALYGFVRGANLKPGMQMHLCGVGDVPMAEVAALPDPCPLPDKVKKRSLDGKERLLYAPMSDVGRLVYDKDAMYINLPDHLVNFTRPSAEDGGDGVDRAVQTPGVGMVRSLQARAVDSPVARETWHREAQRACSSCFPPGKRANPPSRNAREPLSLFAHTAARVAPNPPPRSTGHPAGSRREAEARADPGVRVVSGWRWRQRRRGRGGRGRRGERVERRRWGAGSSLLVLRCEAQGSCSA